MDGKRTHEQLTALYAQIEALYDQGLLDKQIADRLGCTAQTVFRWRKRNGKPLRPRLPPSNKKMDEVRARELYDRGLSDTEIGEIMGLSRSTIATWRNRRFLPCHTKASKKARRLSPLAAVNAAAREHGMTYGRYAALLWEEQKRERSQKNKRKEG